MAIVAERASVSKPTLIRIERGDPGVAAGQLCQSSFCAWMIDRLADLADARNDPVGLQLERREPPERIRGREGGAWKGK